MGLRSSQRQVHVKVVSPDGKTELADLGLMDVPLNGAAVERRIRNELPDSQGSARRILPDPTRLRFNHTITVQTQPSCFSTEGESILDIDEPLYAYYSRLYLKKFKTHMKLKSDGTGIQIGDLDVTFYRTIRVPDNDKVHSLPPGMGSFTVRNVADHAEKLPESIVEKGGAFITMYQREALWMRFGQRTSCAVKVSVGGINAITGTPRNSPSNGKQDYLPFNERSNQVWLDGVATKPGVVKQFVAMPLNEGYTVESQVTGRDDVGGLQFDVYWIKKVPQYLVLESGRVISGDDVEMTPRQLGLSAGTRLQIRDAQGYDPHNPFNPQFSLNPPANQDTVTLSPKDEPFVLYVTSSERSGAFVGNHNMNTAVGELRKQISSNTGVAVKDFKVSFDGKELDNDGLTLKDYRIVMSQTLTLQEPPIPQRKEEFRERARASMSRRMVSLGAAAPGAPPPAPSASGRSKSSVLGIAPGGSIDQKIVRDALPVKTYDQICTSRIHISILNSAMCAEVGLPVPETPVSAQTYLNAGFPWFDLYEEHVPSAKLPTDGPLQKLKSVAEVEAEKRGAGDPGAQHDCGYCTHQMATTQVVPCGHEFCNDCLEDVRACPVCSHWIDSKLFIGAPMMAPGKEKNDSVDKNHPRVVKLKRVAGTGMLITFRRPEDDVWPLTSGTT